MPAVGLTTLTATTDLAPLEAEWRALEARADASFFISWGWIGPWLQTILPRTDVYLFRAVDQTGELFALATLVPCRLRRGRLFNSPALSLNEARIPGLNMIIEYNDLLFEAGKGAQAWTSLFTALQQSKLRWAELLLSGLSEASYQQALAASRHTYPVIDARRSPWAARLEGKTSLDSVLAPLSRNRRWQIRRSIKHYEESTGPLSCHSAETTEEALAWFEEMGVLHTARWNREGMSGSFANPNWVAFHQRIIEQHFASGQVQLLRVTAGETTLGVIYSFIWRGQVCMLQTGLAAATDNNQRPGYIAHCMAMALNGQNGLEVYDFMCGDADYKQSLATEALSMVWGRLRKHRLLHSVEDFLIAAYRRVPKGRDK